MPVPDILYHYTDQTGFLGIIETKSFWASKIRHLNDTSEFLHGISVASALLRESAQSATDNLTRKYCETMEGSLNRVGQINVFVVCFSANGNLLSQWRAYSKAGIGYSLGFDTAILERLGPKQGFRLAECIYDGVKQREVVSQLVTKRIEEFKRSIGTDAREEEIFTDTKIEQLWGTFSSDLITISPLLKHVAFAEEREWRLISVPKSSRDPAYHVRGSRNFLVPYCVFSLEESPGDCKLNSVIVGPCPDSQLASDGVTGLLGRNGIKWKSVRPSGIPFRPS
jgi:hypothetical protein